MPMTEDPIRARLDELRASADALGPVLIGNLLKKRARHTKKDGTQSVYAQAFMLQYRGDDGRRTWKRIPRDRVDAIRKLLKAGAQHQKLSQEHAGLLARLALLSAAKKND